MDKTLLEALKKYLPEEALKEVGEVAEQMVAKVRKDLTVEFNAQLEEAYAELSAEKEEDERVALQGYHEAYALINDLRNRMVIMREEYEKELIDGFQEAFEHIESEKAKNNSLSVQIYDEYDTKLNQMKEFVVDKLDEFLHKKGSEIYEQAKRDILNDPVTSEHKVAMDQIAQIVGRHISDEEQFFSTSNKLEETNRQLEDLKAQMKMLEGRNIKLSSDNNALNERVREFKSVINESRQNERKTSKKPQVSGRGHKVFDEDMVIIAEHNNSKKRVQDNDTNKVLSEDLKIDRKTLNLLAGTIKDEE